MIIYLQILQLLAPVLHMQKLWTLIGVKNQCWRISKLRKTPCWRISSGLKNRQIKRKPMLKNQLRVDESANWENPCWRISSGLKNRQIKRKPMLKNQQIERTHVEESPQGWRISKFKEPMLKNQQIDSSNFSMRSSYRSLPRKLKHLFRVQPRRSATSTFVVGRFSCRISRVDPILSSSWNSCLKKEVALK